MGAPTATAPRARACSPCTVAPSFPHGPLVSEPEAGWGGEIFWLVFGSGCVGSSASPPSPDIRCLRPGLPLAPGCVSPSKYPSAPGAVHPVCVFHAAHPPAPTLPCSRGKYEPQILFDLKPLLQLRYEWSSHEWSCMELREGGWSGSVFFRPWLVTQAEVKSV